MNVRNMVFRVFLLASVFLSAKWKSPISKDYCKGSKEIICE
jgi:hypothetical protein